MKDNRKNRATYFYHYHNDPQVGLGGTILGCFGVITLIALIIVFFTKLSIVAFGLLLVCILGFINGLR